MIRFTMARAAEALFALLVVSIVVFLLARLTGNPIDMLVPMDATAEQRADMSHHLGLDKPAIVQYTLYIGHAFTGDFGTSLSTRRPVSEMIGERLPNTLRLGLISFLGALLIAIPIGVYSAVRRGGLLDGAARLFSVLGQSLPAFWLGIVLIQIFAVAMRLVPAGGIGGPVYYILPTITLAWYVSAGIMRLTRSSMLDVMGSEYIKLARIKGLPESIVVWKHAFKNALLPVLTFSVLVLIMLLGGALITETIFAWPGVGRLVVDAVTARDFPVVQTVVLMLSAMYIFGNFMVDVAYGYLNPKIRYR